ncbi:MAG: hypothetical protein OIN85_09435 [Candidatus Methanoperedens sp.]|nr:hypothetical protein [Candidatus Methanoperedens sp.]
MELKTLLDVLFIIVSMLGIILGGLWGYYKWKNELKGMREEEGLYDPRLNMFVEIKTHEGRSDETKLVEINGFLKNIGRIPIQVDYSKSRINIYQIPKEYQMPIGSAFLKPFKTINFTNFNRVAILDTGITYPIPTTIYDLSKKGIFYFDIIFDIGAHKDSYSRKNILFPEKIGSRSLIYNITLLLPEDASEVTNGSLE